LPYPGCGYRDVVGLPLTTTDTELDLETLSTTDRRELVGRALED
jgi:hypothetical protein